MGVDINILCSDCAASINNKSSGKPASICYLCLNAVEAIPVDDTIIAITAFDCNTFDLALTLPLSALLRQAVYRLFINNRETSGLVNTLELKPIIFERVKSQICKISGLAFNAESDLLVHVSFEHAESAQDHRFLADIPEAKLTSVSTVKKGYKRQAGIINDSRESVGAALKRIDADALLRSPAYPPIAVQTPATCKINVHRNSIYFGGRYLKLQRHISQTPWILDGVRKTELSVSECIGEPLLSICKGQAYNLVSSGREDADVRMLGSGRPFYIEVTDPKVTLHTIEDIKKLEQSINSKFAGQVEVRRLTLIEKDATKMIKEGEVSKTKSYCALVWVSPLPSNAQLASLSNYTDLMVQQKTPLRVLHRRSALERPRIVHTMSAEVLNADKGLIILHINTEAGMYIKEFVHGDMGRTIPNLGSILDCSADLLELDVIDVQVEWPPQTNSTATQKEVVQEKVLTSIDKVSNLNSLE